MNTKVKTFFDIFVNSLIPQPSSYIHLLKLPLKKSFRYFISLIVFVTVLYSIYIAASYTPASLKKNLMQIRTIFFRYPKDMTIEISKGYLYTNRGIPYSVWLEDGEKVRMIVEIDESAPAQKIHDTYALVLVNNKEIVFRSQASKNKTFSIPLKFFKDQVITKKTADKYVKTLDAMEKNIFLYYIVFFMFLFASVFAVSFAKISVSLFFASVAVYTMFRIYGFMNSSDHHAQKLHYNTVFHIGLHAITLPVAVMIGLRFFNGQLPFRSFTTLVILFIFTGIYEVYYGKKPAHHHS